MNPSILARRRGGFVALLAGLALATAVATGVVDTEHSPSAAHEAHSASHATDGHATDSHAAEGHAARARTISKARFHDQMRKLWEDHVTWTRLAIVTFADGSASFDATAGRLLRNQEDIGDAIKPYYGKAAGDQLTALLKDHITIAVRLLQAAKDGDDAGFQQAHDDWYANSDDIADFLAKANRRSWPRDAMRAAMKTHLDQTLAEASHELTGDYAASVADYDEIHHHILMMADTLSRGIVRAFPHRFH
ncbi:hypothetical protein [Nocardioides sp.]|uniref:hypothetical protein n=1 Tax=Nocardioides sp. TaxID=35761 RepID=UPI00261D2E9A|nr:hypothetical protein [Nocardioides sp.]MDI6910672.1 hypothetical protein [Nocardioides sp.]